MSPLDVLLLFPGSLFGETWADGPRVKPELVGMLTYLRRHDLAAGVLDLEVELGGNPAAGRQEAYLAKAEKLLLARPAAIVPYTPDEPLCACLGDIQMLRIASLSLALICFALATPAPAQNARPAPTPAPSTPPASPAPGLAAIDPWQSPEELAATAASLRKW